MADNGFSKLAGLGQVLLGVGFIFRGIANWKGNGTPSLAALQAGKQGQQGRYIKDAQLVKVRNIDERVAHIRKAIQEGSLHPAVIEETAAILTRKCGDRWCVQERDYMGEVSALFWASRDPRSPHAMRYMRDHVRVDQFHGAHVIQRRRSGDCFVKGTKVLNDKYQLVPVESLRVGDNVWGLNRWSQVMNTWDKGRLKTWAVRLNNGGTMRLTPDHKVWVWHCKEEHSHAALHGDCSCGLDNRELARVTVRELKKGMVVSQPARIPFGVGTPDRDRTLVEGLFLSDGWGEGRRFSISGKDGHPKEANKKLVEKLCAAWGIPTRWHKRYIAINDKAWAQRLGLMGHHAPEKHALDINLAEAAALALLEGIMADSGKNTHGKGRTFTTTSYQLFLQTRVLLKMAGVNAGSAFITDHGGLGENPVWRLYLRGGGAAGKAEKLLRVKDVVKDNATRDCFDIETDDHFVWLPEADWTTSQCDDGTIRLGSQAMAAGYPVKMRVVKGRGSQQEWDHIYLLVGIPPTGPTRWVPLDWSVETATPGWEAPGARQVALSGRPHGMIEKLRDFDV